jgi:hypothetical protein
MRVAAQIAMVLMLLTVIAAFRNPVLFFGGLQVISGLCLWVVGWYVLFTLPRELVDRHAANRAHADAPREAQSKTSGGLGDYNIHRA